VLRADAVFFLDGGCVEEGGIAEGAAGPGIEDPDMRGDELHGVGVAGDDDSVDALPTGLAAERADNVVGFIFIDFKEGDAEGFYQVFDAAELVDKFNGSGGALGFIVVEELVAEGGAFLVEGDGVVGGLEVVEDLEEHGGEAVDGADDLAGFGDGEGFFLAVAGGAEGVKGAVDDGVTVKEDQERFFHGLIITEWGRGQEIPLVWADISNITL